MAGKPLSTHGDLRAATIGAVSGKMTTAPESVEKPQKPDDGIDPR